MWSKRTIATVAVAGLAVAGVAGVAVAAGADDDNGSSSRLESLVEDGTLTQEEADAAEKAREALRSQFQAEREERQAQRQAELDELAGIIGISADDLVQRWQDGESLEQIAGDKAAEVEAWLTEQAQARLAELEAAIPERVDGLMQRTAEDRGGMLGGRGHGRGPGMGFGMDLGPGLGLDGFGSPDEAETTTSSTTGSA